MKGKTEVIIVIDIVFDTLGGDYTFDAFEIIKEGGKVTTIAGPPDEETAKQMGMTDYKLPEINTKLIKEKSAVYKYTWMQPNAKQLNDIKTIDEKMIIAFMQYLVIERKVSTSYQNQSINAIKFYYERVLGGHSKIYLVERPRKEKTLPEVLSEEELVSVIQKNRQHKAQSCCLAHLLGRAAFKRAY